jgi:hypothetical protein
MHRFLEDIQRSLGNNFSEYRIEYLIKTPKSLKAKIYLHDDYFIALRYNARNGRIDVALIKNNQRIFGYDNLKEWHFHPYDNPSEHIPCESPSIEKIISDIRKYYEMNKQDSIIEA